MKNMLHTIQIIFTAIGGYIGWLMGGFDGFMYALLAFVAIDYITGLMVAVLEKKLSSDIGFRGIFKKILIFIMVGIANIIDIYLIKNGSAIRTATIFFYIANESISIFENTGKIGLPIPEKLKKALEQLNKEDKSNE
ncbi:toxin secretion/phage lysis holin [Ruminiclostridium sufflavum DSM 19573]|uniref:Toxin secretion/phage lysis holin n=1 Tax=Ruminiclostridium sufflavum DSM 19573 TaxID=1121337 RepID=A0A318XGH2_9FIRM|nr:phage holin family protein [Ruminiclostridium sufflavum]PYG84971.1 toxin secretion/phage lysis holin [Ruminiclostridium sufflavum DSM 19573]